MGPIVVTGDLLWDCNVVQLRHAPAHHHEPVKETLFDASPGGAWFLARMVELACSDAALQPTPSVMRPSVDSDPSSSRGFQVAQAYSLWSLHPACVGEERQQVWRIERFLGCHAARNATDLEHKAVVGDVANPDVLVIDDLNLGFRDAERAWPLALGEEGQPRRIVLKTVAPLGVGKLWERLIADHADSLTAIVSVAALRGERGMLSKSISWDLTIEEIVREFEDGLSRTDLGRCRRVIVSFGAEGAACFSRCSPRLGQAEAEVRQLTAPPASFDRFLYLPGELEGSRQRKYPGTISGATSILTAAMVRHESDPKSYPLFVALARGLTAVSRNQEIGGGDHEKDLAPVDDAAIRVAYHPELETNVDKRKIASDFTFRSAFPHGALADARLRCRSARESDLLGDATGVGTEYVLANACNLVFRGAKQVMADPPYAEYGKYLTFDREEIERINALRGLIDQYQRNGDDRRPLSVAVFGPPGSGKSFAIKQLAEKMFGKDQTILEFNLSQFAPSPGALHDAFHQARDASVRGFVPLVFWDEFDSHDLYWLREFLAPMQDAEFREGSLTHPFGKAIFIFAGGVFSSFENFQRNGDAAAFAKVKGPDFVSRLRGFVNIKGPNPMCHELCGPGALSTVEQSWAELAARDPGFMIRRAIILRSALERTARDLIDPGSNTASVSATVVRAFLLARRFHHGARSLESIVTMSSLAHARHFAVSDLPPSDQLLLHVTPDFVDLLRDGEIEGPVVEALAEACHEAWRSVRTEQGWTQGSPRDDGNKIHPLLVPYGELSEGDKEQRNRSTARLVRAKVGDVGYAISRRSDAVCTMTCFGPSEEDRLAGLEHDIWLRSHLIMGYQWGKETNESRRLHPDVAALGQLTTDESEIDRRIVRGVPDALWKKGYVLSKVLHIGITGHRTLSEVEKVQAGVERALAAIEHRFAGRPLRLVSPLAEGADRLVARLLLRRRGARLIVPLPVPHAEYLKDFARGEPERSIGSREEFENLLDRAESVFEMPPSPSRGKAYEKVAEYILATCDVLIAVWDGQGAQGVGGTAKVVSLARARGLPIAWIHATRRTPGAAEPAVVDEGQENVTFENFCVGVS